jgi:hypothetical protein
MNKELTIREMANILAINVQTLRRWDASGRLVAKRKKTGQVSRYFYDKNDLEEFLSNDFRALSKLAGKWASYQRPFEIPPRFYCSDKSIFKAQLSRLEYDLHQSEINEIFSLIVAIAGEIGNNSYDHNLGNWPDMAGTFFGYSINARKIILADRGRGVLKTLRQVRPNLSDHSEALKVAFTELLSGRAPEARGNGLKYVREVVTKYGLTLFFQSGDASVNLGKRDSSLKITKSQDFIRGVFALIRY